jgi:hypothetical protein
VLRYRDRILAHNTETAHDNQVLMDDIYAFCIICLALRDWLEREKAATKDDLRVFFERSVPLQVCRDIANGVKHLELDRNPSTSGFSIGRQYKAAPFVVFESRDGRQDLVELPELVKSCVTDWQGFLKARAPEGLVKE